MIFGQGAGCLDLSIIVICRSMDIEEMLSYTHELELENTELKKHIFNVQMQLDEKNEQIQLLLIKAKEQADHATQCQLEITKREQRELHLIATIQELQRESDAHLDRLSNAQRALEESKHQNGSLLKQLTISSLKVPPKVSQKCRSCELLTKELEIMGEEFSMEREKSRALERDFECLLGTIIGCQESC